MGKRRKTIQFLRIFVLNVNDGLAIIFNFSLLCIKIIFVFSQSVMYRFFIIEPTGRTTRQALEQGEKYCPLSKIEVKKKKVVKTQNIKI